ncbi:MULTISPECIES: NADP-dependent oxidoreductase [unclassified Streptomyces]|uniref:NADP-dependent oxidoreductase n=1 Tax=unclassified Streptomyces TaxID=2593676 RepID=UPI00136DFE16|nr:MULTISPECIES: NADP-dependent oxidoreductase [unclassified Streptomyces]MYY86569.1 zinc-binding dehydrogenase [Streptomyces sp. SID335]MYZ14280.1 zinc-binding dehydrogenase [Streptomyces sp. SID337]NDZ90368.1 NADP-dependent oxidoreductase [Streptomyces sp. SID10115]NEB48036.1 NADP-dependent oxidoreductase [Streptomyces sp. SID339]
MRAVSPRAWGAPENLVPVEVDRPEPGLTEILVRVHAAGVNPVDWKTRAEGAFGSWGDTPILGYDVSGVVEQVGPGVTLYQPGDAVFGMPRFPEQTGGYAEFVAAPARRFAPKPAGLSHVEAAALPLAALTAWQGLIETAGLRAGQRALIHAAAGGVGHLAVQIAKAHGAYVIGTARADKHEFLRSLGADEVVDYTRVDFTEAVRDVDVVLDGVGGAYGARSLEIIRPGGHLVTLPDPGGLPDPARAAELGVHTGWTIVEPDRAGLLEITRLVDEGKLRVEIDTIIPLEEAAKAHARGERGRTQGKIVLSVV